MDDWEEIITTIGQIEGCVENYLNNTIYVNYGAFNHNTLIEIG
jgi:hypothetical protein